MSQGLLGMLARGRLTGSPNQISTVQKRWALQKKSRFCLLRKGSMSVEREEKQQRGNLWILKTPLAVLLPSLLFFSGVSVTSSYPCVRVSKARSLYPQVLEFSHVSPWISVRVGQCISFLMNQIILPSPDSPMLEETSLVQPLWWNISFISHFLKFITQTYASFKN